MKSFKTIAFIATIFFSNNILAQWSLSGNNITTGNYLGTNNFQDLRIFTDGVERMYVSADGEVKIGTTPPEG